MRTVVVTIAAHRLEHLRNQLAGLARCSHPADAHIVVAMGDPAVLDVADTYGATGVWLDAATPLPLARARNLGARTALALGAELLVFLDVDCVPDPAALDRYRGAALAHHAPPTLLCGPVTYLGPDSVLDVTDLPRLRDPHPARTMPPDGHVRVDHAFALFWSLSFALTAESWRAVGGFCTRYRGYGGEDTDFAFKAAAVGARMLWIGGAHVYHQYHPVSDPPVEHLDEILVNAALFHRRWGWWPMRGWLDRFAALGLVRYDPDADRWCRDPGAGGADVIARRSAG